MSVYKSYGDVSSDLEKNDQNFWLKQGEEMALDIFQRAAKEVPAYKDFLKKNGIDSNSIKNINDFEKLPTIDKASYISQYSLDDLSWPDRLEKGGVVYSSSGTTGKPSYWVRDSEHDLTSEFLHQLLINKYFRIKNNKTLFIDCFAMGIHVAGYTTAHSINQVAKKQNNIYLATPGSKKEDVINLFFGCNQYFEQIVFVGYPPLIKNIIEEIKDLGFDWRKKKIGFLFAAQGFTEEWREYLRNLVCEDEFAPILNIYGSADAGPMAFETPLTIQMRQSTDYASSIFSQNDVNQAYLFQYMPIWKYFEEVGGELVLTSDNIMPLIRYNIHDMGGIIKNINNDENIGLNLPMLYLFGRSNYSLIFYGANIYPEHMHMAVQQNDLLADLTGNYLMEVKDDDSFKQQLHLHIEVKQYSEDQKFTLKVFDLITQKLCQVNKEFLVVFKEMNNQNNVIVNLYQKGHEIFNNQKIKNKYLKI